MAAKWQINSELAEKISEEIEYFLRDSNYEISYIDAIIHYCEINDMEIETIAELISKNQKMKYKLMESAESLHFMKKTARIKGL